MWEPVEVDTLVVFFLFNVEITTLFYSHNNMVTFDMLNN